MIGTYLQVRLKHIIYVVNTTKQGKNEYWKLDKALYRLKHAGHQWYQILKRIMKDCGLLQAGRDLGRFFKKEILIGAHVDDFFTGRTKEELDQIEKEI